MSDSTIHIPNTELLFDKMKTMEFYVEWTVTSDIGPSWIGSSRTIDFYLDDAKLMDTDFVETLKNKLIKAIPIPSESKDHVIQGNGDITLKNNQLEVDYEWYAAIPYQDVDESKEGKIILL